MTDDSTAKAIGGLEARMDNVEKGLGEAKERRADVYKRVTSIEQTLAAFPNKEEWDTIKSMAKAMEDRQTFWADLRRAIATRGILAALAVAGMFYWEQLVALVKH